MADIIYLHRMADAGLEERATPRPAPRSFVPPLPRAHLRMVEPGERIDLYASLRDGGHDKAPARHPASQRQRDDALDRATAVGFVGLTVMLLVALAIGAMLAAGRV